MFCVSFSFGNYSSFQRSKESFVVDQTSTPFVYFFFISANFFATPCPLLLHNGQGIAFA
nr:MAG TPA: hypothetical protein [Bacteriophage sp.]